MGKVAVCAALAALAAGCAGSRQLRVDDLQLARLPPDRLGEVNDWRLRLSQSSDAVTRAELELRDAQRQLQIARSQADIADAQKRASRKALDVAEETRDADAQEVAREDLAAAHVRELATDARVVALEERVDYGEAHRERALKERELVRARLEEAKFHALADVGDPAARQYSQKNYDGAIDDLGKDVAKLQREEAKQRAQFSEARRRWERLRDQAAATTIRRG